MKRQIAFHSSIDFENEFNDPCAVSEAEIRKNYAVLHSHQTPAWLNQTGVQFAMVEAVNNWTNDQLTIVSGPAADSTEIYVCSEYLALAAIGNAGRSADIRPNPIYAEGPLDVTRVINGFESCQDLALAMQSGVRAQLFRTSKKESGRQRKIKSPGLTPDQFRTFPTLVIPFTDNTHFTSLVIHHLTNGHFVAFWTNSMGPTSNNSNFYRLMVAFTVSVIREAQESINLHSCGKPIQFTDLTFVEVGQHIQDDGWSCGVYAGLNGIGTALDFILEDHGSAASLFQTIFTAMEVKDQDKWLRKVAPSFELKSATFGVLNYAGTESRMISRSAKGKYALRRPLPKLYTKYGQLDDQKRPSYVMKVVHSQMESFEKKIMEMNILNLKSKRNREPQREETEVHEKLDDQPILISMKDSTGVLTVFANEPTIRHDSVDPVIKGEHPDADHMYHNSSHGHMDQSGDEEATSLTSMKHRAELKQGRKEFKESTLSLMTEELQREFSKEYLNHLTPYELLFSKHPPDTAPDEDETTTTSLQGTSKRQRCHRGPLSSKRLKKGDSAYTTQLPIYNWEFLTNNSKTQEFTANLSSSKLKQAAERKEDVSGYKGFKFTYMEYLDFLVTNWGLEKDIIDKVQQDRKLYQRVQYLCHHLRTHYRLSMTGMLMKVVWDQSAASDSEEPPTKSKSRKTSSTKRNPTTSSIVGYQVVLHPDDLLPMVIQKHLQNGHGGVLSSFKSGSEEFANLYRDHHWFFATACKSCALIKRKKATRDAKTVQPIASTSPMERVQADLVDFRHAPGFDADRGRVMKWLLNVHDHFSRFSFFVALPNKRGETVCKALQDIFDRFTYPTIFQTDNGREFCNTFITTVMENRGIPIVRGRPRHPQSQGSTEASNKFIKTKLRLLIQDSGDPNWVTHLNRAASLVNHHHTRTIGKRPVDEFIRTSRSFQISAAKIPQTYHRETLDDGTDVFIEQEESTHDVDDVDVSYRGKRGVVIGVDDEDDEDDEDDDVDESAKPRYLGVEEISQWLDPKKSSKEKEDEEMDDDEKEEELENGDDKDDDVFANVHEHSLRVNNKYQVAMTKLPTSDRKQRSKTFVDPNNALDLPVGTPVTLRLPREVVKKMGPSSVFGVVTRASKASSSKEGLYQITTSHGPLVDKFPRSHLYALLGADVGFDVEECLKKTPVSITTASGNATFTTDSQISSTAAVIQVLDSQVQRPEIVAFSGCSCLTTKCDSKRCKCVAQKVSCTLNCKHHSEKKEKHHCTNFRGHLSGVKVVMRKLADGTFEVEDEDGVDE